MIDSLKQKTVILLYAQNHPRNIRKLDFQTLNSVCSSQDILHNGNRDGKPKLTEEVHMVPLLKREDSSDGQQCNMVDMRRKMINV